MNFDPELDLTVERIIAAPRRRVWQAWTDPASFEQWWVPAPALCRVDRLEVRPGGGLVTRLSQDGRSFGAHLSACFILVEDEERIVFSNAIDGDWRPAPPAPVAVTADITMADHAVGTDYRIVVRHGTPDSRARHAALGFADGWGTVAQQLATFVESGSP